MRHRLRLYVLCLLIVSLPVQGIAGVVRIACGMAHDAPAATDIQPAARVAATEAGIGLPGAGHQHPGAPGPGAGPDGACGDDGAGHRAGCGTCGGCSIGAYAPPPGLAATAVEEAANGIQPLPPSPFPGHIPSRIERPPRRA